MQNTNAHLSFADLVIVGGGLVGSAVACAVAQAAPQLKIVVCESREQKASVFQGTQYDPRVVALSETCCEILSSLGVWPQVVAGRVCPYRGMAVWDGEGLGAIGFDSADSHRDALGYIIEHSLLLSAFRNRLFELDNVRWCCPAQVETWHQEADGTNRLYFSNGWHLNCDLLVAADGANSALREQAGITTRRKDYHQTAIVTTVRCAKPHGNVARQRFSSTGPLAFLPLPPPDQGEPARYCSIVWSQDTVVAEQVLSLADAEFCDAIGRAGEHCLGDIEWVDRRYGIELKQMHAVSYGRGGFALVGDAAHRIHPLAGQGANLGIYDAKALAEEIARASERNVPLTHDSLVKRYQRRRRPHNAAAALTMEGFKTLFADQHPVAVLGRNSGMSRLNKWMPVKRLLMDAAAGRFTG